MTDHINCRRTLSSTAHALIMHHSAAVTILEKLYKMCKHAIGIIAVTLRPALRGFIADRPEQIACRILETLVGCRLPCHCCRLKLT